MTSTPSARLRVTQLVELREEVGRKVGNSVGKFDGGLAGHFRGPPAEFVLGHAPSKTVAAGPRRISSWPGPSQTTRSLPPGMSRSTVPGSMRPSSTAAATQADAPVPQARVMPAPRSQTRALRWSGPTTCTISKLTRSGKVGSCSTRGPMCSSGKSSTDSRNVTAWGVAHRDAGDRERQTVGLQGGAAAGTVGPHGDVGGLKVWDSHANGGLKRTVDVAADFDASGAPPAVSTVTGPTGKLAVVEQPLGESSECRCRTSRRGSRRNSRFPCGTGSTFRRGARPAAGRTRRPCGGRRWRGRHRRDRTAGLCVRRGGRSRCRRRASW